MRFMHHRRRNGGRKQKTQRNTHEKRTKKQNIDFLKQKKNRFE